jgi:hypothetical protein
MPTGEDNGPDLRRQQTKGSAQKKETHGLHPVGFWGEKQPSRDGIVDPLAMSAGL